MVHHAAKRRGLRGHASCHAARPANGKSVAAGIPPLRLGWVWCPPFRFAASPPVGRTMWRPAMQTNNPMPVTPKPVTPTEAAGCNPAMSNNSSRSEAEGSVRARILPCSPACRWQISCCTDPSASARLGLVPAFQVCRLASGRDDNVGAGWLSKSF